MLRIIPAKRSRTRDGLAHAKEEQKDKQDPKLNSLAQGDGNQLLSEKQKIPTRRHQERGRQAVHASYIEMLIFSPQFPKFSISRGWEGISSVAAWQGSSPLSVDCVFLSHNFSTVCRETV